MPDSARKRRILVIAALLVLVLIGLPLVQNDYALYDTTIVQVEQIRQEFSHTEASAAAKESYYTQTLTCYVKNGDRKGETVTLTNTYSSSGIREERYRTGDCLFVSLGSDGGKIYCQKRDVYLYVVAALLLLGVLLVAGTSGLPALLSTAINVCLLVAALHLYLNGHNIFLITAGMVFVFSTLSLLLSNGWSRCTQLAIVSTLLSMVATGAIYCIVRACSAPLQYQLMEFAVVPDDLSQLFLCEVMVGSLGAVMDVAISIVSTVDELLVSNPDIESQALLRSIREVGFDIMGTMVNVLFFTYLCGGLPTVLLMLKNNLGLTFIWQYQITFELVRFLVGSIGIVLTVPIAEGVAMLFLRERRGVRG